jgi:hypothetical protein
LEIAAAISHIPTASATTGYIFAKPLWSSNTSAENAVKTPSWTVLEGKAILRKLRILRGHMPVYGA